MISSFFSSGLAHLNGAKPEGKKGWVEWLFTQGGGLSGLALGYFLAAPSGASEASRRAGHAEELVVVGRTIGFTQGRVSPGIYPQRSIRPA
jgi:hypothetical protein